MIIWLVAIVLGALVPFAYATPLDPTYIPGIWDNADYDDVVILATSSSGATDSHTPNDLIRPLVVMALVAQGEDGPFPAAWPAPPPPRAPPAD
jgi:hypothetical protein